MRSRSTCDLGCEGGYPFADLVSISDEKPLHMRRTERVAILHASDVFQSQMRSRSTCDASPPCQHYTQMLVSISDEKPLHMRPLVLDAPACIAQSFNLR